jgi:Fe-S oxidoreductase
MGKLLSRASPWAKMMNHLAQSSLAQKLLDWVGVTTHRSLPPLAQQTFSAWMKENYKASGQRQSVVLFNDTYTEFLEPHIGIAAIKVLTALGCDVIMPSWKCCGRPLISKGLLRQAKHYAEQMFEQLIPYAQKGQTIICLEPSCLSALADDYQGLINNNLQTCVSFDAFLLRQIKDGNLPLEFSTKERFVKLHGHCHQKALFGNKPTLAVLQVIPGCHVQEIDSGCCGMAGGFGFEQSHYEVSIKCGERVLLPAVREAAADSLIVADGFSCREQIAQSTKRRALHLAEVVQLALRDA